VKPAPPAAGAGFQRKVDGFAWESVVALAFQFTASATVQDRSVYWAIQDGDGFTIVQIPLISQALATDVRTVYGGLSSIGPPPTTPSVSGHGSVAAPGANTAIVSVVGARSGQYLVEWSVEVSGTLAAGTDNDNMQIVNGTDPVLVAEYPAVAGAYPQQPEVITLIAGTNPSIKSIGAATAGSTYTASLLLIPQQAEAGLVELPDILVKSGWSMNILIDNAAAGDQISNIGLLLERINEPAASGTDEAEQYFRFLEWMRSGQPAGG
jgi:hypothetical protein